MVDGDERLPITRIEADGTELDGTARVIRDEISGEILRVEDYRDERGELMDETVESRFVLKLTTGENPGLTPTLDEVLDHLEDEQGAIDARLLDEARRAFE